MVSVNWQARPRGKWIGLFKRQRLGKRKPSVDNCLEPFPGIRRVRGSRKLNYNHSLIVSWAESFIFAGSSALLLLLTNFFPHYWYLSFFALVPFLFRIIKTTPNESLRLGFLLGISFFAVSVTDSLPISPIPSLLKLLLGTGLFAVFGWTVGWARKHWGFYPSIVAILWIGLELGVMKLGVAGGLFGRIETSHPLLQNLITLLGFLTVSVIIVLLNSLLVLAIVKTLELTKPKEKSTQEKKNRWLLSFTRNLSAKKVYVVPEGRAPPLLSVLWLSY